MNGLGAVLLQKQLDGTSRPVCYASRSLSKTEQRYAVIEKEALAATWANEKFRDFVTGLDFELQTDHKPLVPLLSSKDLSQMPSTPHGRKIRTTLPRISAGSVPANIREREGRYREKQAITFNRRHRAHVDLPTLNEGESVLIRDQNCQGHVIGQSTSPRSYVIQNDQGSTIRRNRGSLIALCSESPQPTQPETQTERETVTPELCQTPVKSPAAPVRRSSHWPRSQCDWTCREYYGYSHQGQNNP